tara:strand:+ start:11155 stop:11400 length:246 start_codon:yes stop_codon:yes gene_type:complete
MALTKQVTEDYEVRTQFKHIQVRTRTAIIEDSKEISYKYSRRVLNPDMNISSESAEIKALANALWTDEVKSAWTAKQAEEV